MPQLRKDPIIGRWVIISTERAKRPGDFTIPRQDEPAGWSCPFCQSHESLTPHEIYADRVAGLAGWNVRVIPSIAPFLKIEGELDRRGVGLYDVINGIGAHEIVIETPQHIYNIINLPEEQIVRVINAQVARVKDLQNDKRFKYILLFKNYGYAAGASNIKHARSQLIATPINPKRVKEELVGARKYYDFKERCIFCDMIKQEIETGERIIAKEDGFVVIAPFASRFPFEMWILPTEHSCDFYKINNEQIKQLARILKSSLTRLSLTLDDPPYNYVLHTAPFRNIEKAGYWKTIDLDFHWHIEIMPRLTRVAGFEWGTGFYINPTPPEEAAKFLREVRL